MITKSDLEALTGTSFATMVSWDASDWLTALGMSEWLALPTIANLPTQRQDSFGTMMQGLVKCLMGITTQLNTTIPANAGQVKRRCYKGITGQGANYRIWDFSDMPVDLLMSEVMPTVTVATQIEVWVGGSHVTQEASLYTVDLTSGTPVVTFLIDIEETQNVDWFIYPVES
jgi:hypothetical protein